MALSRIGKQIVVDEKIWNIIKQNEANKNNRYSFYNSIIYIEFIQKIPFMNQNEALKRTLETTWFDDLKRKTVRSSIFNCIESFLPFIFMCILWIMMD